MSLLSNGDCLIFNATKTKPQRFIRFELPRIWWEETKAHTTGTQTETSTNRMLMMVSCSPEYMTAAIWQDAVAAIDRRNAAHVDDPEFEKLGIPYFTLQKGDALVFGLPDSPDEFASTVEISKHFGTERVYIINEIKPAIRPGGRIHHFQVWGG